MKRRELARHCAELGFTPRDPVRWLSPISLGRTGLKVAAATLFADFGDKRELEAGLPGDPLRLDRLPAAGQPAQPAVVEKGLPLPATLPEGLEAQQELWIDFTADLGDGFDATYSVALLLAEEQLSIDGRQLRRGNILVLGGDEVYPVASPALYEDRMVGPYRSAFGRDGAGAAAAPATSCPPANVMLALPGNHDWYDGLTTFIRVFTRQRSIGQWRTVQSRSYFGVRLSGGPGNPGWWLLGLDSQLGQYIDEPQLDYFYRTVTTQLQPGDAIILCLASPYWVYADSPSAPAFRQVNFFEQDYLRRRFNPATGLFEDTGASVRLWLSGDLHHYSRFENSESIADAEAPETRTQLITCGLGGAYLADTHWLPDVVTLPEPVESPSASGGEVPRLDQKNDGARGRRFKRTPTAYPAPAQGRALGRRLANPFSPYWLPVRNPGFGPLLGLLHSVIFLAGWTVYSSVRGQSLMGSLEASAGAGLLVPVLWFIGLPLVLLGVVAVWLRWRGRSPSGAVTSLRGALYQASALGVSTALALLLSAWARLPSGVGVIVVLLLVFASGWVLGSEAFALFILGTRGGEVSSWRMSGQAIEDHKGFLRMHLGPDGSLTLYPVVVDEVCHDWSLERATAGIRPVPASGLLPHVRFLEEPITISRKGSRP
ncbi:hypothetical protein [Arthrobacter sp. M4]|uniref:hypothetical protein n=1 Tax=Arthrobacter sp. M4 TaxID=218160 RepID=UPI001CDB6917|nr:hypothetical protein [Arthrobacter sp. M4]MCA4133633.1 hypothetical protein [Arthrobacter sp. M4]